MTMKVVFRSKSSEWNSAKLDSSDMVLAVYNSIP